MHAPQSRDAGKSTQPQAASVILPSGYASAWGNYNNAIPMTFGITRYQQVFPGTELPTSFTMQSLSFRRDEQFTGYAGGAVDVEILLGCVALYVIGFSDKTWGSLNLPLSLTALNAPGCNLLVSYELPLPTTTDDGGNARVDLAIPSDKLLKGRQFFNQFAIFDRTANGLGIVWSNGATATIDDN